MPAGNANATPDPSKSLAKSGSKASIVPTEDPASEILSADLADPGTDVREVALRRVESQFSQPEPDRSATLSGYASMMRFLALTLACSSDRATGLMIAKACVYLLFKSEFHAFRVSSTFAVIFFKFLFALCCAWSGFST
eukprot:961536-Rhodomonas_salina.1